MKIRFIIILAITFLLWGCEEEKTEEVKMPTTTSAQTPDTSAPVITLRGKKNDTTYLKIVNLDLKLPVGEDRPKWRPQKEDAYYDEGAEVQDEKDGDITLFLETTGKVNNRIVGTYFLTYNAKDAAGNMAAPVTRTVHVLRNSVDFLNGNYNVACGCTITAENSSNPTPTVTITNYTASVVTSSGINKHFELSALNIGPEYSNLSLSLNSNLSIDDIYSYLNPIDFHPSSSLSGTVSSSKNTFTVETKVRKWIPSVAYICKNIYTKSKN